MHKDESSVDCIGFHGKQDVDGDEHIHQQLLGQTQPHVVQEGVFEDSHSILS